MKLPSKSVPPLTDSLHLFGPDRINECSQVAVSTVPTWLLHDLLSSPRRRFACSSACAGRSHPSIPAPQTETDDSCSLQPSFSPSVLHAIADGQPLSDTFTAPATPAPVQLGRLHLILPRLLLFLTQRQQHKAERRSFRKVGTPANSPYIFASSPHIQDTQDVAFHEVLLGIRLHPTFDPSVF